MWQAGSSWGQPTRQHRVMARAVRCMGLAASAGSRTVVAAGGVPRVPPGSTGAAPPGVVSLLFPITRRRLPPPDQRPLLQHVRLALRTSSRVLRAPPAVSIVRLLALPRYQRPCQTAAPMPLPMPIDVSDWLAPKAPVCVYTSLPECRIVYIAHLHTGPGCQVSSQRQGRRAARRAGAFRCSCKPLPVAVQHCPCYHPAPPRAPKSSRHARVKHAEP